MKWRFVTEDDLQNVLIPWWSAWKFPVPPVKCLPERGVIVSDEEGDLYGGFLYLTDGRIGWMEWVVSNKGASVKRRRGALLYLIEILSKMAKEEGMVLLFTSTVLEGFRNSLNKCGFMPGDSGMYQLIKSL